MKFFGYDFGFGLKILFFIQESEGYKLIQWCLDLNFYFLKGLQEQVGLLVK